MHVINIEIKDNHEDAAVGGQLITKLAQMVKLLKIFEFIKKFNYLFILNI